METDSPGAGTTAPPSAGDAPGGSAPAAASPADTEALWASDPVAAATAEFEAALAAEQAAGGDGGGYASGGTPPPAGEGLPAGQQPPPTGESQSPDELAQLRAENERLKAQQPQSTAAPELQRIRRFLGIEAGHEGGPTLDQLSQAISRRDYAALNAMKRPDGQTGYSLEEALDLKASIEGNQAVANDFATVAHGTAWGAIGSAFDEQVQSLGLDSKAIAEEAGKSADPLAVSKVWLSKIVEGARKAGREDGVKEWKGKHDGLQAEFTAFKAQSAGGAPRLETGGRGNGTASAAAVLALKDDEFVDRAIRGDFSGLDLSDN